MSSPLQEFKAKNLERWSVLQDIPSWEVETILTWLKNVLVYYDTTGINYKETYNYGVIRSIETRNRLLVSGDLGINTGSWSEVLTSLRQLLASGEYRNFIIFLECVVKYVRDSERGVLYYKNVSPSETVLANLEWSLERGSMWTIVWDKNEDTGLVERVNPEITQVAKSLENAHLTKAWNAAFAVKSEPEKAIEQAQRAIEELASQHGLTKVTTSVYGKLLGDIKSNPNKYMSAAATAYELADKLGKDPKEKKTTNEQFADWFWHGLNLIQRTNPAHHASTETKDFVLPPDAGKQAVLMATVLAQLISSGYFAKS